MKMYFHRFKLTIKSRTGVACAQLVAQQILSRSLILNTKFYLYVCGIQCIIISILSFLFVFNLWS